VCEGLFLTAGTQADFKLNPELELQYIFTTKPRRGTENKRGAGRSVDMSLTSEEEEKTKFSIQQEI